MTPDFETLFTLALSGQSTKEKKSPDTFSVATGIDGSIVLSWSLGSLTVPAWQREALLGMISKAVHISKEAVPNPQPK